MKFTVYSFLVLLLYSCNKSKPDTGVVPAYVPVYSSKAIAQEITLQTPQPIINGGKIATQGNYVFQVEEDKGIHIIDYSNPASPVKKGFIKIALCRELTLNDHFIYTNNLSDLVVIDISDPAAVTVTKRIENAFPDLAIQYPPQTNCYFECADLSKGVVIEWKLSAIDNPKCKR